MRKDAMGSFLAELDTRTQGVSGPTPFPVNLTQLEGLDLSARYHSDRSGGDFFDGLAIGSRVIFLLTDIAGPRSEAHAIAAEVQNAFRQRARDLFAPPGANESDAIAALAHEVNRSLIDAAGRSFCACLSGLLQPDAWHPHVLQCRPPSRRVSRCGEHASSRARRVSVGALHARHL
jgi:hypothetical protein